MNYVKLFQSVSDSIRSEFYSSHSCTVLWLPFAHYYPYSRSVCLSPHQEPSVGYILLVRTNSEQSLISVTSVVNKECSAHGLWLHRSLSPSKSKVTTNVVTTSHHFPIIRATSRSTWKKSFIFPFVFHLPDSLHSFCFFWPLKCPLPREKAPLARRGITIVSAVVVGQ